MELTKLGYNTTLETYRKEKGLEAFGVGRVISEHKERYVVKDDKAEYEAEVTGNLRFTAAGREDFPAVGDWVAFMEYEDAKALIHQVYPRKTVIERQAVGSRSEKQIIAANIDYGLIVQAVDRDFNIKRAQRYLAICYESGVKPAILLSKIDLIDEGRLIEIVEAIGKSLQDVPVFPFSNESESGFENIRSFFKPGISYCLLGSSGVGKSTLINRLTGREAMKTGEISTSTSKGKHVTSHRELIVLPEGGIIIDNPGMREVGITDSGSGIEAAFDMISQLADNCRYDDCRHISEKGCAVIQAVQKGELDEGSYQNYIKLEKEKEHFESTVAEKRRKGKEFGRIIKDMKRTYRDNNMQ
jgi:ribosome biogenesis GTPase